VAGSAVDPRKPITIGLLIAALGFAGIVWKLSSSAAAVQTSVDATQRAVETTSKVLENVKTLVEDMRVDLAKAKAERAAIVQRIEMIERRMDR